MEFVSKGVEREMVASPDGVIPHRWAPVATQDLANAVRDAVATAAPAGKIDKAQAFEIRASLRFGPLEKPKVYYTVQVAKSGTTRTLKFKPDGTIIKAFAFPKRR